MSKSTNLSGCKPQTTDLPRVVPAKLYALQRRRLNSTTQSVSERASERWRLTCGRLIDQRSSEPHHITCQRPTNCRASAALARENVARTADCEILLHHSTTYLFIASGSDSGPQSGTVDGNGTMLLMRPPRDSSSSQQQQQGLWRQSDRSWHGGLQQDEINGRLWTAWLVAADV